MSTIDNAQIIRTILRNGGWYPEQDPATPPDPQCTSVWAYWSPLREAWTHAVYYKSELLQASEYVELPTLLWSRETGITYDGHRFSLDKYPGQEIQDAVAGRRTK